MILDVGVQCSSGWKCMLGLSNSFGIVLQKCDNSARHPDVNLLTASRFESFLHAVILASPSRFFIGNFERRGGG